MYWVKGAPARRVHIGQCQTMQSWEFNWADGPKVAEVHAQWLLRDLSL